MVKTGHTSEPSPVEFLNRSRPASDIEVFSASSLLRRVEPTRLRRAQRMGFHLMALYTAGRTTHTVDFTRYACRPGTLIRVQPGQVQQLELHSGVEAMVVLFTPAFLFPSPQKHGALWHERFFDDVSWPTSIESRGDDAKETTAWFERLARAYVELETTPLTLTLLRHLLSVVLLDVAQRARLSATPSEVDPEGRARLRRFQTDLERSFRVTRTVADYAQRLGCSAKTLDRLCRTRLGASAKTVVDRRVTLEARRLLSHTTLSVAGVGEALGFSEPTNFVKFFKSNTGGVLPGVFRASVVR